MEKALKLNIAEAAKSSRVNGIIGRYLFEHEDDAVFLTAQELAQHAGVSQGSVTRFCFSLGFSGYGEFQKKLQKSNRIGQTTAVERMKYLKDINQSDIDIIESEKQALDRLYDVIRTKEYKYLIDRLIHAKKIYLISARLSATVVQYLYYGLCKLRDQVTILQRDMVLWDALDYADPENIKDALVIAVSFPRYSEDLVEKLDDLNQCGYELFAITDSLLSPAAQRSRQSLMVPLTRKSIFDVYSTPLLLFNLILKDVAVALPGFEERMIRMEQDEKLHGVYYEER